MGGTGTALPIAPAELNPELAESGDLEKDSHRPGLVSGLQGIDPNIGAWLPRLCCCCKVSC